MCAQYCRPAGGFNSLQVVYQLLRPCGRNIYLSGVSIPYRQSINKKWNGEGDCKYWFQFLIGSLSTFSGLAYLPNSQEFQFLIGSLSTWHPGYKQYTKRPVSIPYRQSINDTYHPHFHVLIAVFQFLIGSLSTLKVAESFKRLGSFNSLQVVYQRYQWFLVPGRAKMFQFLIGSLSTDVPIRGTYDDVSFNSLQVVYQPYLI